MRTIGVLLIVLLIAAIAQTFRFDSALSHEKTTSAAVDRDFGSIDLAIAHFRGAQAGYLATGQTPATWMTRATDEATRIEASLGRLRVSSQAPAAKDRYQEALKALAELTDFDGRARNYFRTDQRFLASDLIYMDSAAVVDRLTSAVQSARAAEAAASQARFDQARWLRFALFAGALLAAVGLGMVVRMLKPGAVAKPKATTAEMLKSLPPAVKPATAPAPAPVAIATPAATTFVTASLAEAAELCSDLARVADGRDVPALVERAAKVLDAKGVVLWVTDPSGAILKPSVTHGYTDKVLARLGPLLIDSDNVTTLAYRSMRPQAITSQVPGHAGALAVPLITANGCVGVFAAEIKQNRSGSELMPLAKIIAAQFAALMAPGEAVTARTAQA
jgi:hypothetical protein